MFCIYVLLRIIIIRIIIYMFKICSTAEFKSVRNKLHLCFTSCTYQTSSFWLVGLDHVRSRPGSVVVKYLKSGARLLIKLPVCILLIFKSGVIESPLNELSRYNHILQLPVEHGSFILKRLERFCKQWVTNPWICQKWQQGKIKHECL